MTVVHQPHKCPTAAWPSAPDGTVARCDGCGRHWIADGRQVVFGRRAVATRWRPEKRREARRRERQPRPGQLQPPATAARLRGMPPIAGGAGARAGTGPARVIVLGRSGVTPSEAAWLTSRYGLTASCAASLTPEAARILLAAPER
jgi:hypothetical protein